MQNHKIKENSCDYCGDAPANHAFLYLNNVLNVLMEPQMHLVMRRAPIFLKKIASSILGLLFKLCVFLKIVRFSEDMERAVSLRSKIVWQEAQRQELKLEQIIALGRPTEHFRVKFNGKFFYFESLPISLEVQNGAYFYPWDDKFFLKKRLARENIPVPKFEKMGHWSNSFKQTFSKLQKPLIVKPAVGSRARHTTTNIHSKQDLKKAIDLGFEISPVLVVEEHLEGYVCRATVVGGELVGFYRGEAPYILGDGKSTIEELIQDKNQNRPENVSEIKISKEISEYISRSGFVIDQVLPKSQKIFLTHRTGRYFGGRTKEMLPLLHPSFVPILEMAGKITGLPVLGFDCIIPDPESREDSQRWGIIECNTLPFIDLHYFAFEGEPSKNIAGAVWEQYLKSLI